ncbi:RNA polymerase factor sigma-54 [Endozoicomonas sp. SCSIO W0465]|uniref:RNA polymerase factor sigma-54 n=1 Tax=Endozoicomonas sp. SCSIO W0465 TaxID=2918516 RepID=UPI002075143A|nr:RNA polymerase factor sigma-54 [Endozoicomonas sp. SCSIO W0465]USE38234.1 RNA polymerase factor sigma-54 [Endozoicomonas sp. SCSIO W0465]
MKPSLQLKMGQQLTMTPQLQQAIRLLQLSTLDLQQEIQEALESNPMLESEDSETEDTATSSEGKEELVDLSEAIPEPEPQEMAEWADSIPNELPVDSAWDDVYSSLPANGSDEDYDPLAKSSSVESLQDHLEWQLDMVPMSDRDRLIGLAIIEAVNPNGYLTCSLDDLYVSLQSQLEELEIDEIKVLQHRVQQFDPVGCGSIDLKECLLVQLRQLPPSTPHFNNAEKLITLYLDLLGTRDYARIMRRAKLKEDQLRKALSLIQSFHPKPGSTIDQTEAEYVVPDISVRKIKERWSVELNSDALPKLRINNNYASMVQRANNSRDNVFMKNHLQEARWFLKNLQSRNETLMKVASQIIAYQQDFFEKGDEAMKPLVLADIAEAVGMHESTISRVTTQKYMHTPRGVYELKYFFSSHVSTAEGGECSSTAIRAHIRKLIAQETPRKPLSDNKIAAILAEQGIKVARRTIAKYRESMNIPPSNERKQLVP